MSKIKYEHYYVPEHSRWPIITAFALFLLAIGAGGTIHGNGWGAPVLVLGFVTLCYLLFGWFGDQIKENMQGLFSQQLHSSYHHGMRWFIFSEVMFFAAFFGALFYTRTLVMPWLGGEGNQAMTHALLWPDFIPQWPLLVNPENAKFIGATEPMGWWGLALINTILLVSSSFTLTQSHHGILEQNRSKAKLWIWVTLGLGTLFISLQAYEYYEAYHEMGLTLSAGIYGSTFFLLTGFHGMHVTLGVIMLTVMALRIQKGHFSPGNHFAFEASAWYWHFVDVVWIGLFLFVYIL